MTMKSTNETLVVERPVIIVGCPRSGTLLMSRILGGCKDHFLITEHSNKLRNCPEDRSGVDDAALWWGKFDYEGWDRRSRRPPVETPVYNRDIIADVRSIYLSLSRGKRLVLKNPSHLCRIPFLKEMFPKAFFVFCARNPWHTLQSMTIKGNESFLLRTKRSAALPEDLLLKAAVSWQEAAEVYQQEKDDNWILVKYEDIVSSPAETIGKLFHFLEIRDQSCLSTALRLPKAKSHHYDPVRKLFFKSRHKAEMLEAIEKGNKYLSYPLELPAAQGGLARRFFSFLLNSLRKGSG
jgi:hypothetical protein